ncbi:MAG: hypothetical protein HFJ06_01710 [Lachnospiraceae bacterium]|nr:hypothetical protein [Lachnospiraceae bacterium]
MLDKEDIAIMRDVVREVVDDRITKSENLVLEEVGRIQQVMNSDMERLQRNIEELKQYYRIAKLENDNTSILLKMVEELTRRIEELEKKTA